MNLINDLTIIVLTYNEKIHIERCITCAKTIAKEVIIVDSYSNDGTVDLAATLGATVYSHEWPHNHSIQFNWALENCRIDTKWVMRLDADEIIPMNLMIEINKQLKLNDGRVKGYILKRGHVFYGKKIKYGGVFPLKLLRIWEHGNGICESRLMDEHIVLKKTGKLQTLNEPFWDNNLNNISSWIHKHNSYSSKEAVEQLNRKYNLYEIPDDSLLSFQAKIKKFLKNNLYEKLPSALRSFIYFSFRYFIRFGFLDGYRGFSWHVLQGFWYRFLVDLKVYEIERKAKTLNISIRDIIIKEYNIKL